MKKLFPIAFLLIATVSSANPLAMMKAENELNAKKREVLTRSIRLQEEIAVAPKVFKEVAEVQLVPRYMIHTVDGKDELIELSAWEESLGLITLKKPKPPTASPSPPKLNSPKPSRQPPEKPASSPGKAPPAHPLTSP